MDGSMAELCNPGRESLLALVDHMQARLLHFETKTPAPLRVGYPETRLTKWTLMETWSAWEAALLVTGFDPSTYQEIGDPAIPQATGLCGRGERGAFHFRSARHIQDLWTRRIHTTDKITPFEFIEWCKSVGVNTDWLAEFGAPITPAISKPKQRATTWREAVLATLVALDIDPMNIPAVNGRRCPIKQKVRDVLKAQGVTSSNVDRAWTELRREGKLGNRK